MDDNEPESKPRLSNPDEVMALIMENPGITGKQIAEKLGVNSSNAYNYIARLRKQMRIKTIKKGAGSVYYPFDFATVEIPGLEKPGVPLRIGEGVATARTLSPDELKALMHTPAVPSKYASLIGYLDRLNIGEAAVFKAIELKIENVRGRIYEYFNKNKDNEKHFSINNKGEYIIIERTQ
jgi:transcriptional regulator with XRE-family HTH domain